MPMISLTVNGRPHAYDGDPAMPLIWFLRDVLNMTEIKHDCLIAKCKACMVQVNSSPYRACKITMLDVHEKTISTVPVIR